MCIRDRATAASPFVCKNVGGLPCIEGLHLQDCIAEGTWGNESPHFGFNLPSLCYEFKTLVRNTFLPKEPRKRRTFSKNRSQNPLKSRPGGSKIEPRSSRRTKEQPKSVPRAPNSVSRATQEEVDQKCSGLRVALSGPCLESTKLYSVLGKRSITLVGHEDPRAL